MIKWIKDFEGTHAISTDGTVYRIKDGKYIEISVVNHNQGYLYCTLTVNGKSYNKLHHRLIAEAFVPNPENKKYVNHKNGKKKDNAPSNLEWVTNIENCKHAYETNLNSHRKAIAQYTLDNKLVAKYDSIREAQVTIGKPNGTNIACCLRLDRCKTAYGYVWRYLNEEHERS